MRVVILNTIDFKAPDLNKSITAGQATEVHNAELVFGVYQDMTGQAQVKILKDEVGVTAVEILDVI